MTDAFTPDSPTIKRRAVLSEQEILPGAALPPSLLVLDGPAALRDFFSSRNLEELAARGRALAAVFSFLPEAAGVAEHTLADWRETEYAYNRIFIGPGPVAAPPHASVYLMREPQLMGAVTLEVRKLFAALNLAVPHEGSVPDDHLVFELDGWIALSALLRTTPHNDAAHAGLLEARRWFLAEHMATWIPAFLSNAFSASDCTPPLHLALAGLRYWLEQSLACIDTRRTSS